MGHSKEKTAAPPHAAYHQTEKFSSREAEMRSESAAPFAFLARVVVASALAAVSLSGQTPQGDHGWVQPKTAWGDPDLQGLWSYATLTPLERPAQWADRATISEQEAAEYQRQSEERSRRNNATAGPDWWDARSIVNGRTSLIVDPPNGRLPPPTPDVQKLNAARSRAPRNESGPENLEEIAVKDRCLYWEVAGPPMVPGVYNNNVQLVQAPGYVVIVNEMNHDARIVPLNRPHGSQARWMGDSRGHWEGNTLVVDTINFTDKTRFRGTNGSLHLIERFTQLSATTLDYRFTVDAPATWTSAWTASVPMTKTQGPMYEYACHEGNARSLIGILSGARYEERHAPGR
jgi:hypothetical protein